jgi:hypothetical protein
MGYLISFPKYAILQTPPQHSKLSVRKVGKKGEFWGEFGESRAKRYNFLKGSYLL